MTRATTTRQRADQEGMTWRTPLVGLGCGMLLWAGVASAEERCRQIEYAELKDMSTTALRHLYCDDTMTILRLQNAQVYAAKSQDWRAVGQFRRESQDCEDMTNKIGTVLRARGMSDKSFPCDFSKELEEGQR